MRAAAVIALGAALLALAAGCGSQIDQRTGRRTLDRAMSRAFKRNYAAAIRMTSGHVRRRPVRHAVARCSPRGPQPRDEGRAWQWYCQVRYYRRHSIRAQLVTYGVGVGSRGCFEARTGDYPARLPERILGRPAPNPLVYIRSCP